MTQATEHLNPDTLSAFIDGELPDGEQTAIEQHLAGCHSCALSVLSATQLKAATARAGRRFAPSPEALARLTAQVRQQPQGAARIHSMKSPSLGRPCRGRHLGRVVRGLATNSSNQQSLCRTTRPTPQHSLQRRDAAGYLNGSPHRQALVPGPPAFQLQSSRCPGPSAGYDPQGREPDLSQRAACCVAPVHDPQASSLSLCYPTIHRPQFGHAARRAFGIFDRHRIHARPADRRRQRRESRRP